MFTDRSDAAPPDRPILSGDDERVPNEQADYLRATLMALLGAGLYLAGIAALGAHVPFLVTLPMCAVVFGGWRPMLLAGWGGLLVGMLVIGLSGASYETADLMRLTATFVGLPLFAGIGELLRRNQLAAARRQLQVGEAYVDLKRVNERLESSLRDQRSRIEQLEAITQSVPGVIFQYAVASKESHGFEFVSANVLPVFGITPDDLLIDASLAWRRISPEDRASVRDQVTRAMQSNTPWVQEFRIVAPERQSQVRWIAVHCVPRVDRNARRVVWTGIVADVDAQREVQNRLWKSQRIEGIGVLAGGIAHDFNNVLTAVVAEVDLLELDFAGDTRVGESVSHIRTAAESGATLSRHLLGFAGRAVNTPRVTPVDAAVSRVAPLLRRLLREQVRLEVDVPTGLGNVRIDPGLFDQVLMNLATNARDAMNGAGTLRISAVRLGASRPTYFASLPPGDYIELAVSDSGPGMPEEVRQHAFEPFFTTKSVGRGSGLGLATSHGIISQADGAMSIDPPDSCGCTIRIALPVSSLPPSRTERSVDAGPRGIETLLVVDDEHQVRRVTIETLRRRGYHVLEAANAADALRLARRREDPIDLLITDVVMPEVDGVALARTMHEEGLSRGVLFVSGYASDSFSLHGVDESEMDLLEKPYRVETLASRVRARLDALGGA